MSQKRGKFGNIFILALVCIIALGSLSLDTVFAYFSGKTDKNGNNSMGYIDLVSVTKVSSASTTSTGTEQEFSASYKVIADTNINFYVYVFLNATITPSGDKTHSTSCSDYYANDIDCLDISISGYTRASAKSADGYTAFYKLCTVTTAGQNEQNFTISASVKSELASNACDYYTNATISLDMKVSVKQADYMNAQEYTKGFADTLYSSAIGSIGFGGSSGGSEDDDELYTRITEYDDEGNGTDYILFGHYPTTIKAESVTVGTTTDDNGYYTGSDGAKYAKLEANPAGDYYYLSNGEEIDSGTEYYFKVEPIKWRILRESNNIAKLICANIIDACAYYDLTTGDRTVDGETVYQNNYEHSKIRAWLNGYEVNNELTYWNDGFLQKAFTEEEQAIIHTVEVSNDASTTDSSSSSYACNNTMDKVYLLSYQDLVNTAYEFDEDYTYADYMRWKETTDYARANYAYTTDGSLKPNGWWWSRSPSSLSPSYTDKNCRAWSVKIDGKISDDYTVGTEEGGVVPVITLNLEGKTSLYTRVTEYDDEDNVTTDYILFGYYPTTIKADNVTIVSTTTDSNGYYTGSDGCKYAKLTAKLYTTTPEASKLTDLAYDQFSNGTTIVTGQVYYFKVEPIKWKILKESNGIVTLLCENVIEARRWDDDKNNYANSEIREWLNGTFLNTFASSEQELIQITAVDNSKATTNDSSTSYACANTEDKVYLLSYAEFTSTLLTAAEKCKKTTDYTRAHAYTCASSNYLGIGLWWLRSPRSTAEELVSCSDYDGTVFPYGVADPGMGVVPALRMSLTIVE